MTEFCLYCWSFSVSTDLFANQISSDLKVNWWILFIFHRNFFTCTSFFYIIFWHWPIGHFPNSHPSLWAQYLMIAFKLDVALGISDDLINFGDETIRNKIVAAAILFFFFMGNYFELLINFRDEPIKSWRQPSCYFFVSGYFGMNRHVNI